MPESTVNDQVLPEEPQNFTAEERIPCPRISFGIDKQANNQIKDPMKAVKKVAPVLLAAPNQLPEAL